MNQNLFFRKPFSCIAKMLSCRHPTLAFLAFTVAMCLGAGGCSTPAPASLHRPDRPLRIVATTGMVADIVRAVVGPACEVTALMGTGVDPHLFKPTRRDVKRLLEADVVFYSGLMLEGRMEETFRHLARSGKPVRAVTDGLDRAELHALPESPGHWDPHVWMNVVLWSECTQLVADVMSEIDAVHAGNYQQRAREYQSRLTELDAGIRGAIASIPAKQRVLITAHDAFGYFSTAYDIPVHAVQGVTTDSEAGVSDVNELVDFVAERRVPALFVESSVNPKTIQAVREGARARGVAVRIGGELFSDAMGPDGTYEGTYLGMLDANVTQIVTALGGSISPQGIFGKLTIPAVREQ